MDETMIDFCEHHVKKIEEYVAGLYTIDCPTEYHEVRAEDGKINVFEEMKYLKEIEKIYSAIEPTGIKSGEIYKEYNEYLSNVRHDKEIIKTELEKIKEKHADDLENAEALLMSFKRYISLNKQFSER